MIPFADLRRQYRVIEQEVCAAMREVLDEVGFILGHKVEEFETRFAAYCGVKHCIGVGNGSDALAIALQALGVGPGDEVIVPANTFIATALAVSAVGATVHLVDVDDSTLLITAPIIERAVNRRTKCVIPVHLFGKPADMDAILGLCASNGILVLEDACQAHGAGYRGRKVGSLGHAAAFSFYPGKNLGCYGDGGAVTTNDDEVARQIRLLRDLGRKRKHAHVLKGRNSRLDAIQAAILTAKLRYLDGWNEKRREHAQRYDDSLRSIGVKTSTTGSGGGVHHLYSIAVGGRDDLARALEEAAIGYGIHYPVPVHLQGAYRELGLRRGSFPVAERWSRRTISLPMFPELSEDEVDTVTRTVARFVAGGAERSDGDGARA